MVCAGFVPNSFKRKFPSRNSSLASSRRARPPPVRPSLIPLVISAMDVAYDDVAEDSRLALRVIVCCHLYV